MDSSNGDQLVLYQAMAALAQIGIIGAAVFAVKGMLGVLDRFGVIANNTGKGLIDRARKKGEEVKGNTAWQRGKAIRKQAKQNYKDTKFADKLAGKGRKGFFTRRSAMGIKGVTGLSVLARLPTKVPGVGSVRAQQEALARAAMGQAAKAMAEAVKAEMERLRKQIGSSPVAARDHILANGRKMSQVQIEAATEMMLQAGGTEEFRQIVETRPDLVQQHGEGLADAARRNIGELEKAATDISRWAQSAEARNGQSPTGTEYNWANASAAKIAGMDPTTAARYAGHLNPDEAMRALTMPEANIKPGTRAALRAAALRGGHTPPPF